MKDVLNAVDDRRLVGTFQNIDDALEPQEIGPAMLRESLKKERERHSLDRLLAQDRIGIHVMLVMRMVLCDGC